MRSCAIILTLLACLLPWAARAQPIQGFYIDGGAGLRAPFAPKVTSEQPGVGGTFELRQRWGYEGQFSVGYALGDGWRFELEGNLGRGAIKAVSTVPFAAASSGAVRDLGVMANALFDLDVRSPYVYPYLGLGFGYQRTRLDDFAVTRVGTPGAFSASGTAGAPAVQIIGGLSFPIPNMPGLSLTVDYRVMDILGGEKFNGTSTIAAGGPLAGAVKFHNQFDQNVIFGVRYAFNTPPPPPPEAPQAMLSPTPTDAPRLYQVAATGRTLSARARATIADAALASTRPGATRIAVTGARSWQGADLVVAALRADGVPANAISVAHAGQPTADEPSGDRRIEVLTD